LRNRSSCEGARGRERRRLPTPPHPSPPVFTPNTPPLKPARESEEHRSKLHPGEELYGGSWTAPHGGSWGAHPHPHGGSWTGAGSGAASGSAGHGSAPGAPGAARGGGGGAPAPPAAVGFVRPGGASPPPPRAARPGRAERPRGGVASLLAAAAERAAAGGDDGASSSGSSGAACGGGAGGGAGPSPPGWWAPGGSSAGSAREGPPTPPTRTPWRRGSGSAGTGGSCTAAARELSGVLEDDEAAEGRPAGRTSRLGAPAGRRGPPPRRGSGGSDSAAGASGSGASSSSSSSSGCGSDSDASDDDAGPFDGLEASSAGAPAPWPAGGPGAVPPPPPELRDYSQLPDPVWLSILGGLCTRDLCFAARASRGLRGLAVGTPALWAAIYKVRRRGWWRGRRAAGQGRAPADCAGPHPPAATPDPTPGPNPISHKTKQDLHGEAPPPAWSAPAVRRACRRSELRAARWLEAAAPRRSGGFASTTAIALDASKAVSGDGSCVRVWSHATGRRIATLPGHPGRVSGVAFDDDTLISGCAGGAVRLWSMDELRCSKSIRHHLGPVSAVALLHGVPISAGADGEICLWEASPAAGGGGAPILSLAAAGPVAALDAGSPAGHLLSAGWGLEGWDMGTAQRLFALDAPPPAAGAGDGTDAGGAGFSCVTSGGPLVAAGRTGEAVLWDVRAGAPVAALAPPAAASGACAGLQLDDWKLVAGWGPERGLGVYDLRSLGGGDPRPGWREPAMWFDAPARVTCFRVSCSAGGFGGSEGRRRRGALEGCWG
jgi:hypothetical protein